MGSKFSGFVDDIFNDMITDVNGNIYVIGNFSSEELIFNNDIKLINSNLDPYDTFITKYNANGTCQWAKQIIGNMDSYSGTINIDSLNNIYISGVFTSDTVFFNNNIYTLGNSNNYNIYLSKYNPNGDCQWANPIIGTSMVNSPKTLAIDKNGFVVFSGVFDSPTLDFNNSFTIQHSGNQDIFLARYDSSGTCLNAQKIGDSGFDEVSNIFINDNNEMFMTGYSESDSLDFDNNVIVKRGVGLWGFFTKYQVANNSVILPQITTNSITEISKTSAKSGGTFTVQGNQAILQKGVCWSLNQNPTLADDFTNDGTGTNDFVSELNYLMVNKKHFVRAYVITSSDTIYGDEKSFQTLPTSKFLFAWGNNNYGQLGDSSNILRPTPTLIDSLSSWKEIAAGRYHSLAIRIDGSLWAWGRNDYGQLGDGSTDHKNYRVQIGNSNNWTSISVGRFHSLGLQSDGSLWAWGSNEFGQIGDSSKTNRNQPVRIGNSNDWKFISAGREHSLAIKNDGTLWSWGHNDTGQLGDSTNIDKIQPKKISNDNDWKKVSGGNWHNLALKNNGSLWSWGLNTQGQLGDSTHLSKNYPIKVNNNTDWYELFSGSFNSMVLKSDSTLWAWGSNEFGQYGDSTKNSVNFPKKLNFDSKIINVRTSYNHTLAIDSKGQLWAWGSNEDKQLGDTNIIYPTYPNKIGNSNLWFAVASGIDYSIALKGIESTEKPVISTAKPSNLTNRSVKTGGNFALKGNFPVLQKGVCWSLNQNPTLANNYSNNGLDSNDFVYTINNLNPNTEYFVRAYIIISNDTIYGNQIKFQTLDNFYPVIATNSLFDIKHNSAKSGGTFSVKGNQTILQKGVCWSLNQNPTLADDFTNDGTDSTDYLSQLTKLNQNSNYYIRAYVVIANDTIYGDEKNFQTPQAIYPSLVTKIPYQITKNTATSGGSFASQGDIDIIRKGVCWSVSINPTLFDFSTNDGDDSTDFFSNLTNLTPQTEYYVRAYVIIDGDTIYGTNTNFTTLNKEKPTLTTIAPSQITKYSASSGGTFNIQGDFMVLQKGVCWSVNQNPTVNDNLSNEGSDSTNFVSNIINLTPQTDYYVRAYVIIQGDTIYGTQQSFTTDNYTPPQLTTISISNIKLSSAESGGQFTVVGDLPILSKGVCWSNDILPTINDNYTTDGSGPDDFESIVSVDPNCSSKYYVRAYATTNNGIFYGDTVSFLSSSSNISFYPDKLNRFYSDSTVQIFEIALDNNNDLIIYGQANGKDSVYLNNKSMDINDKTDFIAKIDTNGWVKWIKKIDKVSININEGDTYPIIKVDKNNNIIVSCNFSDFQISCFNCYRSVGYLVKYESNGNKLWDRFINGIPIYYAGCETPICDVEVDSQANIYVVGTGFTDSLLVSNYINYDLDPATRVNYLIKYDSSGTVNWVKIDTSSYYPRHYYKRIIAKNSLDSLFLAGRYDDHIIINGISKFNGDSLSNYEITFDWNFDFELYDFEVDKRDNFYITGLYSKNIKFGLSDSLENNLSDNVNFIAKFDNNFNFLWAKNTTRLDQYSANSFLNSRISFDKNNNVYLVGNVDTISFNLNSCSNFKFNHKFGWVYDGYIMKVTPEGQIDLFSQITGNSKTSMNGIKYLNNSLYVCGTVLSDTTDFLSGVELIKNKSSNGFLARYLIVSPNNNSQNIYLSQGWNLISSNLYIANGNLDTIYKDISNNIVISKNNAGDVFIPSYNINTIGNWELTQGYNVYANNSDTLKLTGILVNPSNRPIQLKAGWNTISYLRSSEMSAINAFTSITDNSNLLIAKTLDGKVYIPSYSINTIGNLKQGVGYKVYVTNADTLVYLGN